MTSVNETPTGRDLRALPKTHLHLHFSGSMRLETLQDLAEQRGIRLPHALLDGEALRVPATQRGWFRFQRLYDAARACVRTGADMARLIDEAVADDAAEGSVRLEIQVDPTSYAPLVGGLTPALEIILDAAARAGKEHGIEVGVIVATSRLKHPLDARTLARLAAMYAGDGNGEVIGFGLSNDERRGDTFEFARAFAIARRAGLASLPHGGELLGPEHVREVIDALAPDRLGHGVRAHEDPRLLDEIIARGIALEICPTSNVSLGVFPELSYVPVPQLLAAGATIALGADDPLLFGDRLLDQYENARHVHGMSDAQIAELARGSVRASRASQSSKNAWLQDIDNWLRS
ncbi:MAG TPA: adenosine deaminase [Actinomycetales bacterium]|nr:adenosine deaminase [Actinomycetales bacterium]